jgi:hypothetical protein
VTTTPNSMFVSSGKKAARTHVEASIPLSAKRTRSRTYRGSLPSRKRRVDDSAMVSGIPTYCRIDPLSNGIT